tara:strand:- start:675 stop:938 length:264 start_codon:yes stop_codon:yes gene_type:complete
MTDKEPARWYDWMGWKLRQEEKKEKPIEDRIVGISAGAGGRNISEEFNIPKPKSNAVTVDLRDVVRHLNRIEAKIDLLLSKSDGGLK